MECRRGGFPVGVMEVADMKKSLPLALIMLITVAGPVWAGDDLDVTFGTAGKVTTGFSGSSETGAGAVALQSDGKIVVAGFTQKASSDSDFALARYNTDGSLDTTFGSGGKVTTDFSGASDGADAVALQSDGKIVAAGGTSSSDFALVRYNRDGSLDPTFGSGGKVTTDFTPGGNFGFASALALQSDGKIVVAGYAGDFALARYNTDGSLDTTFGSGGKVTTDFSAQGTFNALALQPDGRILAGGTYSDDFAVLRYNSDGSLDPSFGKNGIVQTHISGYDLEGTESNSRVQGLALEPDGKIVSAGGVFSSKFVTAKTAFALARYNSDGSLDTTFGAGGTTPTSFGPSISAYALAVQPDGKIVAAGGGAFGNVFAIARYSNASASTTLALTPVGAATTSTSGTTPSVTVGYATAAVNSGAAPYAIAVFSLSQNGQVVSEAAVPASPPVQSARVFVEYRTGITAGIGTIDAYTGLAIASQSDSTASLTYTLRDRDGQIIAVGHGSLASSAHRGKFLHELQDLAPDFNLPANFSALIQYGSLEISSNQPVSVLGLRLVVNQRAETLLTSTLVADLSQPLTGSPLYFPQLADGGGYTTTLFLSNTSGATETGTISISDDTGAPLSVRPVGGTVAPTFSYSVPAGGTFVFQTDGSPDSVRAGWVKVTPDNGSDAPNGAGFFSYSPAGILVTESGIPSSVATTRARLYVDMSNGHDTGLAISNPAGEPITLTLHAFDETGGNAGNGPATVNLAKNGHVGAFVRELINGLPGGFTGVADLTSSSPFVPLTLRSLTNSRGDFLLTTFPVADLTEPAPTPIVFPQIADGGGYTTEFIFISAGSAASVSVNIVTDNGAALSLGPTP